MSRSIKLAIFGVIALAQLAAPAWMIGQREWILRNGTLYKFKTAPVDPYDAFRGRYVWLNFEENTATWPGPGAIPNEITSTQSPVYATLSADENGFGKFGTVSMTPPASGEYLRVQTAYYWNENDRELSQRKLRIVLPFDRYYMNEAMAPAAEEAYAANSRRGNQKTYATVRIWRGQAVLEGVFIGDQRIEDYIKRDAAATH
jgi:uncharacterized membrane-anchored protein